MTRAIGDQPGHPFNEFRRGAGPSRPALPGSASVGVHAGGRQGEEDATLRGSPADVRSGDPSEARPLRAVGTGRSGSANPAGGWGGPVAPGPSWLGLGRGAGGRRPGRGGGAFGGGPGGGGRGGPGGGPPARGGGNGRERIGEPRWGMGGAGAGPPLVTAARRACTE